MLFDEVDSRIDPHLVGCFLEDRDVRATTIFKPNPKHVDWQRVMTGKLDFDGACYRPGKTAVKMLVDH